MSEPDVKVCPRCGAEYQLHMVSCLDCDTALVFPGELPAEPLGDDSGEDADHTVEGEEGVLLRSTDWRWARALAADLEEAGIPSFVSSASAPGAAVRAAVWVRPDDEAAARAIDQRRYRLEIPPLEGEVEEEAPPPRRRASLTAGTSADVRVCARCGAEYQLWVERCFDCDLPLGATGEAEDVEEEEMEEDSSTPAAENLEAAPACPACGEPITPGIVECPECGLAFAIVEIPCPWCGTANDSAAESCTRCGTPLHE